MSTNKLPLTGIIHAKNAQKDIEGAIKSLDFCDEVLVADMQSTDQTGQLAKKAGAKVIEVDNYEFADPVRQQMIELASYQWIFVLDADEKVPAKLASMIEKLMSDASISAYAIPRKNLIFDHWLKHTGWWPDYQVRLFQKSKVKWPPTIHTHPVIQGEKKELPASNEIALIHQNYSDITSFIERLNRYTSIQARESSPASMQLGLNKLLSTFAERAIFHEGWKDGKVGLQVSLLQAIYDAVVSMKQWEIDNSIKDSGEARNNLESILSLELTEAIKTLNYWRANYEIQRSRGWQKFYWRMRRKLKI